MREVGEFVDTVVVAPAEGALSPFGRDLVSKQSLPFGDDLCLCSIPNRLVV